MHFSYYPLKHIVWDVKSTPESAFLDVRQSVVDACLNQLILKVNQFRWRDSCQKLSFLSSPLTGMDRQSISHLCRGFLKSLPHQFIAAAVRFAILFPDECDDLLRDHAGNASKDPDRVFKYVKNVSENCRIKRPRSYGQVTCICQNEPLDSLFSR